MTQAAAAVPLRLDWTLPLARTVASRWPVVLMYHGVPPDGSDQVTARTFERHVQCLKNRFDLVAARESDRKRIRGGRIQVVLTFDDGFRNNAEVVAPILRRHRIPAEFFVSSRHSTPGRYLWFAYLRALERWFPWRLFSFRGETFSMAAGERQQSIQRLRDILLGLRPHPGAMYDAIDNELPRLEDFVGEPALAGHYAGMTAEQVGDLAAEPLFSVGVHTVDHPLLTRCEPDEARRQIDANRTWLESVCGRRCEAVAYPGGDYSADLIQICQTRGFSRGYVVARQLRTRSPLERERIGIYSRSLDVLQLKVQWGTFLRFLGLSIG